MKTVNLRFIGINSKVIPNIYVDGQVIKCKKNDFGSYEVALQTEKDEIQISFSRELELKGRLWWLYALISFIVSVFGIFEPPYDRKCITMNCAFSVKLGDADANLIMVRFNTMTKKGRAVEIDTQNEYEEISNAYEVDKTAKRRWAVHIVFKLIAWVAIAVIAGYLISKYIGG